jgi:hypothetical protein
MVKKKETHILSQEVRSKLGRVGKKVRNDVSGMADRTLIALAVFTGLLLFWWGIVGTYARGMYEVQWAEMYPGISVTTSYVWHIFKWMDIVTTFCIIIVWVFTCIYVYILVKTDDDDDDKPPVVKPKPKPNHKPKPKQVSKSNTKTCPHCKSVHTRNAGGDHKGEMFCMSCREYY